MAAREQRDDRAFDDLVLAYDDFGDFGADRGVGVPKFCYRFLDIHEGSCGLRIERCRLFLLNIIKVISDRTLVSPWHFFLAQGTLRIGLRSGGSGLIFNFAGTFDTNAFESYAWHLATR